MWQKFPSPASFVPHFLQKRTCAGAFAGVAVRTGCEATALGVGDVGVTKTYFFA